MKDKIDPRLLNLVETTSEKKENKKIECIVYATNYSVTLKKLRQHFLHEAIEEYPFILAFGVYVDHVLVNEIAGYDEVSYIASNFQVTTCMDVSKKVLKLNTKNIPQKFSTNFTVAVIDTGIAPIADLCVPTNRIVHFKDFVNNQKQPYDDNGHGTFVASVLAGNGLVSGTKYAGIDKNAGIIALKALDANGETGAMTILKAMQWVYDNKEKYNIKVVCMSFGSVAFGKRDPLIIGAEVLWNAGIVVVCAAGNSGPDAQTIRSPGVSNKIITVGSLNDNRSSNKLLAVKNFEIAKFSSRGPALGNYKPDLVTPGVDVVSACNYKLSKKHYSKMNGTSVSAPMVAGVCSLMLRKNLSLTPNEIKHLLIESCTKINDDRNSEGFGLLYCNELDLF